MIKIDFDISELNEVGKNIKLVQKGGIRELEDMVLKDQAQFFIKAVKPRTPKKTGALRKHWTTDNENLNCENINGLRSVRVTNKSPYALNAELGKIEARQIKYKPGYFQARTETDIEMLPPGNNKFGRELTRKLGRGKFKYERDLY